MTKPLTLTDTISVPDINGSFRFRVEFGAIPFSANSVGSGQGGQALAIKNANITFPQFMIGQVRSPAYGFPRAFRGHEDHQNRVSMSFYEDALGGTWKTLWNWRKAVKRHNETAGELSSIYGIPVRVATFSTTGAVTTYCLMRGVWPTVVTPPPLSVLSSEPSLVEVEFSVDDMDFT